MSHGLVATLRDGAFTVYVGNGEEPAWGRLVTLGHEPVGAVYGLLDHHDATSIVERLANHDDPGGPDTPWIAVSYGPDSGLAACASTSMTSGVFWADQDGQLTMGTDPRAVANAGGHGARIDPHFIREFSSLSCAPDATPYVGVARVPAGHTIRWRGATAKPAVTQWCGPEVWPDATVRGTQVVDEYRERFDSLLLDLVARCRPLVTTVSGGLDSTLLAISLARLTSGSDPVVGLTYSPLPGAVMELGPRWDADESPLARLLAASSEGRLVIRDVINWAQETPLDAAATAARLSGVPSPIPANQVWLSHAEEIARELGARVCFSGQHGNAALSFDHAYAAPQRRRGRSYGQPARRALRRLTHHADRQAETGESPGADLSARFGLQPPSSQRRTDRSAYLQWLGGTGPSVLAAGNPAGKRGLLTVDPFTARSMLDFAASIAPEDWRRGYPTRAMARAVGAGRVPDEIRLRVRRGQQGRDSWHVVTHRRDEYLDRAMSISQAPGLEHVNVAEVISCLQAWPWGEPAGPRWPEQVAVEHLLALAEFASAPIADGEWA